MLIILYLFNKLNKGEKVQKEGKPKYYIRHNKTNGNYVEYDYDNSFSDLSREENLEALQRRVRESAGTEDFDSVSVELIQKDDNTEKKVADLFTSPKSRLLSTN